MQLSSGYPTLKPNNIPNLPHKVVYLPYHDEKQPNLDLGESGEDIAYLKTLS